MRRKPNVAIIGPGNLGTALAVSLCEAGYRVTDIVCRSDRASTRRAARLARKVGAKTSTAGRAPANADVFWICVPDQQIRAVAEVLSRTGAWKHRTIFHSSGALTSEELVAFRRKGAQVASVHPMMTFVPGVRPSLRGVPFGIEGDRSAESIARRIVRDLGAEPFVLGKRNKAAYHAWGAFASPLLIATLVTAERVADLAGINSRAARAKMLPIITQTLQNYAHLGAAAAFSGPIVRGDAETVRKHLKVLSAAPAAKEVYVALARAGLKYLPSRDRAAVKRILG